MQTEEQERKSGFPARTYLLSNYLPEIGDWKKFWRSLRVRKKRAPETAQPGR
jgi:hypothetical protein